jgi:autotransporter passenger strand-loop-strand repeat protein
VSAGGTDLGALISGGEQDVFGYASGAVVASGVQAVESGGTAINTVVSSGGVLELSTGAVATGFTIQSGGTLEAASGFTISAADETSLN